jgi:hypothetical protein
MASLALIASHFAVFVFVVVIVVVACLSCSCQVCLTKCIRAICWKRRKSPVTLEALVVEKASEVPQAMLVVENAAGPDTEVSSIPLLTVS